MPENTTLGPIVVSRDAAGLLVTLAPHGDIDVELPPDYEAALSHHLGVSAASAAGAAVAIDLQDLPAITSRQLGALLALHRVVRNSGSPIRVLNTTPTVRRVFQATNTAQFFQFS